MTAIRFLALAGAPERLRTFLQRVRPGHRSPQRLNRELDRPGLVVFTSPETPLVRLSKDALGSDRGLIVGRLYRRDDCAAVERLGEGESRTIIDTGGGSLLHNWWGSYACFLDDGTGATVLRDPSAAVPVYCATVDDVRIWFPDLAACEDVGIADRPIDAEYLRQWLTFPNLRTARTGVQGVTELLPGTAHHLKGDELETRNLWTPWRSIGSSSPPADFAEAAQAVRSTVTRTIAAQLKDRGGFGLELSGGLDSAIVAAALAAAGITLPAVNFSTRSADGDERDYARAVADHLQLSLSLVEEDLGPLVLRPPARTAIRPQLSPVLQPLNRALCRFADDAGLSGLVTGGGGDNLFCYLTTTAPILDALRDRGPGGAFRATRDMAAVTGSTLWKAGRYALRKRARQHRRPAWKRDERFLAPNGIARSRDTHPWLEAPPGAHAGKLEHVGSMLRAHHYMEPEHPTGEAILHPLINQPLMELCLSIPTWLWIHGGRNRAVAREAFADLLPAATINRRTKGRFESMCARAFEQNRAQLADLLLGGVLAGRGLIQTDQVELYCAGTGPAPDDDYYRLFDIASLELWLRARAG